jgi:hypothetical protein
VPQGATPALLFAIGCAVGGLMIMYLSLVHDIARLGAPPRSTWVSMFVWFIAWAVLYTAIGRMSIKALGVIVVLVLVILQVATQKEKGAWSLRKLLFDSWLAATIIAAPAIWVAYLLNAGNW